jgi:ABC-2 type transport system permease protein
MRLLSVELTRLRWRRAVVVLLVACVVVPAVIWAGLAWNTRPVSGADLREAQQQVERDSQRSGVKNQIKRCIQHPGRYGADPDDVQASCEQMVSPQLDWFLYRPQLDVAGERESTGLAVLTILVALVMLIGTTFVGHDWASGSMSNQLVFEPRRLRIWVAKAAVVFLTGLVVSAAVLGAYWGGLWLLAESRNLETPGHQWELIRNSAMRGSMLVAFAGLGGYALTMLFRSTVATLGVLFATTVGGSLVIVAVLGAEAERWLLPTNFSAVVFNGYEFFGGADVTCDGEFGDGSCTGMEHLSLEQGATYLGVIVLVAVMLSLWSFHGRDVP